MGESPKYEINVINLDSRKDRWEHIKSQFENVNNVILNRFSAISDKRGWIGCALSHLSIIEKSIHNNSDYVIIVEDDCLLSLDFNDRFQKIMNFLKGEDRWDIFSFGSTYSNQRYNKVKMVNPYLNIIEYQYGKTATFMIYNKSTYSKLVSYINRYENDNNIKENEMAFDIIINDHEFIQYTTIPFMIQQSLGFSDIVGREVNYEKVYKENEEYLIKLLEK